MASLYWVGGSGSFNDPTHWSTASGGTAGNAGATVTSIPNVIVGTGVGTAVTTPTSGSNDDGYFTLTPSFPISFNGTSYSSFHVGTNGYITFAAGSTSFSSTGYTPTTISGNKLYISNSGDNSCQRIYYQESGTVGSRTFRVRYEGANSTTGTLGSPTKVWEAVFYEATPNRIDIHYGPTLAGGTGTGGWSGVYTASALLAGFNQAGTISTSFSITTSTPTTIVVPSNLDDIIYDSASNASSYTVYISNAALCKNWTVTGPATGSVTFSGSASIDIYGSVSWATTGIIRAYTGQFNFYATSGTINVDFGGLTLSNGIRFGQATATTAVYTLLSNYVSSSTVATIQSGTLDTNGFNLSTGTLVSNSGTYVRSILLRTGTHSFGAGVGGTVINLVATNLTLDAGTSTVSVTSGNAIQLTGAFTFYNLSGSFGTMTITGNLNVTNVLSFGDVAANVTTISSGITITAGTVQWWTTARTSRSSRKTILSALGATTTISATNFINFENVDLSGIVAAGSAPWTTGTSIGDLGNNTGITFPTPKTVYWNNSVGGAWTSNSWATSSGGSVADVNYPIAQDTVIIGDTGLNSGASITVAQGANTYTGSIDSSSRTLPWSLTASASATLLCTGDFKASSGTITSSNLTLNLIGSGTLISAGSIIPFIQTDIVSRTGVAGTYTLGSNIVTSSAANTGTITVSRGTLSMGTFNITCRVLSSISVTGVGNISTTGGVFNITGNATTVVNLSAALVSITGTLNINLTYSGATGTRLISSNATSLSVRTINYNITAGTDIVTLGNTNLYANNLDFTGFSGSAGISAGTVIYGNITFSPTMTTVVRITDSLIWTNDTAGSTRTIDTKGVTINFPVSLRGASAGTQIWNLASNYVSTQAFDFQNGVFNTNNYNMTSSVAFSFNVGSTKTINLGSSTLTINSTTSLTVWSATTTNTTFNAGTSSIIINQTSTTLTTTVVGGNLIYNKVYFNGNTSGIFAIGGSNTFNYFENISTKPVTIRLSNGTTQTFGTLKLNGVRGRRVALQSTTSTPATVAKSGGGVSENDYLDLSYINAAAATTFYAGRYSTTVAGTSTNWVFNFFTKPKVGNALGFFQ